MKETLNWIDLVFENRNKEYGAYRLRRAYAIRVVIAFSVTILSFTVLLALPYIMQLFNEEHNEVAELKQVKYTDLAPPPPIEKLKPPPKLETPPPVKEAVKFLPPEVTSKEVVDETPTMDELKAAEVATADNEGIGEVVAAEVIEEPAAEPVEDPNIVYAIAEQQPEFPGGITAMMKFLSQNMRYPSQARRMGIEGSVFVEFVVDQSGAITAARVIKGIGAGCDEEAVRVVRKMPPWKPGVQNGKPVKVRFVLPLKFVLG